jgi:hypothetical protein
VTASGSSWACKGAKRPKENDERVRWRCQRKEIRGTYGNVGATVGLSVPDFVGLSVG